MTEVFDTRVQSKSAVRIEKSSVNRFERYLGMVDSGVEKLALY